MNTRKQTGYYIFRKSFTRNGVTYYAKDYGKKAFRFFIKTNK